MLCFSLIRWGKETALLHSNTAAGHSLYTTRKNCIHFPHHVCPRSQEAVLERLISWGSMPPHPQVFGVLCTPYPLPEHVFELVVEGCGGRGIYMSTNIRSTSDTSLGRYSGYFGSGETCLEGYHCESCRNNVQCPEGRARAVQVRAHLRHCFGLHFGPSQCGEVEEASARQGVMTTVPQ